MKGRYRINSGIQALKSGTMTTMKTLLWVLTFSAAYAAVCIGDDSFDMDVDTANLLTTHKLCSTECESKWCYVPPVLRYGKYCGIGYSGCDGQDPCDGLDACCKTHDECIGSNLCNYLNVDCNQALIDCLNSFQASGAPQFAGADCSTEELVGVINAVIEIGVKAGEALNRTGKC
ncbi:hypothetical protein Mapa_009061 [Marchantia paleacea]|nr:hypothetical protein Mapa_009061 [Marchantia paleacea]